MFVFGIARFTNNSPQDLFLKVLSATLTTRNANNINHDTKTSPALTLAPLPSEKPDLTSMDYVEILALVIPSLPMILTDNDKIVSACASMSAHTISPNIASKLFPETLRPTHLALLQRVSRVSGASTAKVWKRDVSEIFNHPKLFSLSYPLAKESFLPLVSSWAAGSDAKDRILDLLSRISAPTGAGLMFGVGASAARLDADKRTQANLRRLTLLVLSRPADSLIPQLQDLEETIAALLAATPTSSPSSATRAEIFMLLRALVLRCSSLSLAAFWPLLTAELQRAIASAVPRSPDYETYNVPGLLQACRLLDLLLVLRLDDFQLAEWLFIADTVDAVYRPADFEAVGLVDDLAEEMNGAGISDAISPGGSTAGMTAAEQEPEKQASGLAGAAAPSSQRAVTRTRLLQDSDVADITQIAKAKFVSVVLRPFFARLSIHAYESTYGLGGVDWAAEEAAVLRDVFDERTIVG